MALKNYLYYSKHVDTDDAQIDGDISPVVARVGGYVKEINFEENTHGARRQSFGKIDDRDYKVKLEQAQSGQKGASCRSRRFCKLRLAATSGKYKYCKSKH